MILEITAICNVGCVRRNNEDMVLVGTKLIRDDIFNEAIRIDKSTVFAVAVADGMGGENAGEVASQIVLEMFRNGVYELSSGLDDELLRAEVESLCQRIHSKVVADGMADVTKKGMGSTLVALLYYEGRFMLISAGDSRLYRYRSGLLTQISDDHSLRNKIGNDEIPSNLVFNCFGGGDESYIDFKAASKKTLHGDFFLLCSDGLTDMLSDEEIESILASDGFEINLLESAKVKGGEDNISYALIKLNDEESFD